MDGAYNIEREEYDDDQEVEAPPPVIGGNERRMQVRAYDYWTSLLDGRPCPQIHDLDPASVADFGPHSVLLDFSRSVQDPAIAYLGRALREECGMIQGIRTVADVPRGSLLSRLTDHYLEILATKTPVGFEAEFTNHAGLPTLYRGILMPFTSDGLAIDYVYGVINWKHGAPAALSSELERAVAGALGMDADFGLGASVSPAEAAPGEKAGLWDWLTAARISADEARRCDSRAHAALYAAIGRAHDFALMADEHPSEYAGLLAAENLTVQARAPMTPVVKLVFGADYDKTRLTEYAAALSFARRERVARGEMAAFLEKFDGGLKGVVQAERASRAPADRTGRVEEARAALRTMAPKAHVGLEVGDEEFVLLLARRVADNQVAILTPVSDQTLIDKALRKAAA